MNNPETQPALRPKSKRNWPKRLFRLIVIVTVIWLLGDFGYSLYVRWQIGRFEARTMRDENGVMNRCQEYTLGNGPDAVLLIHGINDSPAVWFRMAPAFAETGFTVRAMRLPGFAMPVEEYGSRSIDDWVAEIDREIVALRTNHAHVNVVAHSLGCAVFLRWLQDHPDGVDSATLLSPAIRVGDQRSPVLPTRWWHTISRGLLFTQAVWPPFVNDVLDPNGRKDSLRTPFTPRRVISQTFELTDMNRDTAKDIRIPLMMVLSKQDMVIDWEAAKEFYNQVGSVQKQLLFNDSSGHVIPVDYEWESVVQNINSFIWSVD